jgi:hypothetical protein
MQTTVGNGDNVVCVVFRLRGEQLRGRTSITGWDRPFSLLQGVVTCSETQAIFCSFNDGGGGGG